MCIHLSEEEVHPWRFTITVSLNTIMFSGILECFMIHIVGNVGHQQFVFYFNISSHVFLTLLKSKAYEVIILDAISMMFVSVGKAISQFILLASVNNATRINSVIMLRSAGMLLWYDSLFIELIPAICWYHHGLSETASKMDLPSQHPLSDDNFWYKGIPVNVFTFKWYPLMFFF